MKKHSMLANGRLALAASVLALLPLAGCLGGPAPRDHFYRLQATPPAAPLAQPLLPGVVEVERPRGDALARERPIVYSEGGVEVTPYGYQLWSDSPTLVIQRQLAEYLRRAGMADPVVMPEMNVEEDWSVRGYLARLEHLRGAGGSRALVELELSVTAAPRGKLLLRRNYREERPAAGPEIADAVSAFDAALTAIFERFVADIAEAR